jgi:hypothetical protein
MMMKSLLIRLLVTFGATTVISAQEVSGQQPQADTQQQAEQQKEEDSSEKKAVVLLEQVIDQAQMLRLPENRIRVQITAADLLWRRNEGRARSLFSSAADGIAETMRNTGSDGPQNRDQRRTPGKLRQELVITVARHDATLAYQLLTATRQPTAQTDAGISRKRDSEANLEEDLLAQIAALDPKLAWRKAEESLEKGQYPSTLVKVLAELQVKDKDAAAKLSDKVLMRLRSENMLANSDAGNLALSLLQPGPRPVETSTNDAASSQSVSDTASSQVLSQSAFTDLMVTVIEAALKATPKAPSNPRRNSPRSAKNSTQDAPTQAQIEQNNARRLLQGLQALLPQIDQYVPSRAQAVRQKMSEITMGNNPRPAWGQLDSLLQQGTADSLLATAPIAPPRMQSRLYQQAALKALDEGNADRARQIANDHLDAKTRDAVLQKVEFQQIVSKVEADKKDELRQTLSRLRSDDERIDLLLQLAGAAQKNDAKLASQLLGEARRLADRRATSYPQFEQQLKVAHAFSALEPGRGFEVLEPGIAQLNELLSAAAVLSGFEVDIFKDGELPLQGGSTLGSVVARYGQELGVLARSDFERAQTTANRFQLAEPRILAQLSIVQGVLGGQPEPSDKGFGPRGLGQNTRFLRR